MAERLTIRAEEDGIKAVWYGDRDVFLEGEVGYAEADKLAHYEDLAEQGRLIELPCAVGDTVYEVQEIRKRIQEYTVNSIYYSHSSILIAWEIKDGNGIYSNLNGFEASAIGKTVFLTKDEAEAKLKELRGEQE